MKKSELNIKRKEEVDYDNNRLVYVMDISRVNTHDWEEKITLSTDDVVSLFDGGYQLGILEQIKFNEKVSDEFLMEIKHLIYNLEKNLVDINVSSEKIHEIVKLIDEKTESHYTQTQTNLVKSFEISKLSNQTRVRDERIKEQMYDFHDHLDRIHNTLF